MYRIRNTKTDFMQNIKVIKFVKQYPSIYDKKHRESNDRLGIEKYWEKCATELNETISEAKQRWRNIKDSYFKYLKNAYEHPNKPRRPYYLAKYLGFLKCHSPRQQIQNELNSLIAESESDDLPETDELIETPKTDPIIIKGETVNDVEIPIEQVNLDFNISDNEAEETNFGVSRSDEKFGQCSYDLTDPDMAFLYSLLPDLRSMNDKQKRQFKIGTLKLISNILGDE